MALSRADRCGAIFWLEEQAQYEQGGEQGLKESLADVAPASI